MKISRIDIIGQNGNDGLHYELEGELLKKSLQEKHLQHRIEKKQTAYRRLKSNRRVWEDDIEPEVVG